MSIQQEKVLFIKDMICTRCIKVVRQTLEESGFLILELTLGKAIVLSDQKQLQIEHLQKALREDGFELIEDKEVFLVEQIKLAIRGLINDLPLIMDCNLSDFLSRKFHKSYYYLSKTFSRQESVTIERYYALLRVEKVKELVEYDEMNFSEIAYHLGYRSVQHLCKQFKQNTGITMSYYKAQKNKNRLPQNKIILKQKPGAQKNKN
ncbi:MAG: helix-turn-helix domain-containing protein [Bacteroidetes bacterium]|nr:MAG: helix-turn-helix domain-containing protein [Bacteroidota bacterium]